MEATIQARFEWGNMGNLLQLFNLEKGGRVQTTIDQATIDWCRTYSPWKTGRLANSPYAASQIGQGVVVYDTPYARRMYYNPQFHFDKSVNPLAGGYWFERMKADHTQDILMEAAGATGK